MNFSKRIVGSCHLHENTDLELLKSAGINWLRLDFVYPFEDRIGGTISQSFLDQLETAKALQKQGFHILGITPCPGSMSYDPETGKEYVWKQRLPWAGGFNDDSFYAANEEGCAEIARQAKGVVEFWQIGNEMDIPEFRGAMTPEQVARWVLAGGRGVKKGNPEAMPGINAAGLNTDSGLWLFQECYSKIDHPFGFAGIDGYFGSWIPGGPQDWIPWIDKLHAVTGMPVLITEWGYSSIGGAPKPAVEAIGPGTNSVCHTHAWHFAWKKEHSEEEQGEYFDEALKLFATHPNVLGSFVYCTGDDEFCWHCGQPECPAECGWGLLDREGNPKKSYRKFKEAAEKYYGPAQ